MNERGQYGTSRVGQTVIEPRYAARRRAVRAVFDMYTQRGGRAPFYVYAELNGVVDKRSAQSLDEANAIFFSYERAPGEVYAAIFDASDAAMWPDPSYDVYRAAIPPRSDRPNIGACAGRFTHERGSYGRAAQVGITLYHSVGDRLEAVKQMDLDWTALYQDLAVQAGELTRDTSPSGIHYTTQAEFDKLSLDPKKVSWWKTYAKPRFGEWTKFRREQLGTDLTFGGDYVAWTERFKTNWDVYEGWMAKLEALKNEAKNQGFKIGVPQAQALPTTVWSDAGSLVQKGAGAVATGIGDVWSIAKWGVIGALAIGGVIALSSVASNLRSGKDPAEKYVQLIHKRRQRAALSGGRQLALPPGDAEMVPA